MKIVTRYKCDFCQKLAARLDTIKRHEAVCLKNPEGKNCYMCEMAYQGEYDPGDEYSGVIKDQCMCVYTDDVVSVLLGSGDGNYAPKCDMYHRAEDGYWYHDREQAEKNLEKYESADYDIEANHPLDDLGV